MSFILTKDLIITPFTSKLVFMDYKYGRDYQYIKVSKKNYSDGVLLTNEFGNWCFLSKEEHQLYLFKLLNSELYEKLKKNFMILTNDNFDELSHRFNDYYWYLGKGTSLHILIPTLRCNFTCRYCYAYRASEQDVAKDMTEETLDKTLDFIFSVPTDRYNIEFSGGEPLLRFDLVKKAILRASELAKENNKVIFFSIITNGAYITDEVFDFFTEYKVGICLSLDGPKDIHDDNRRITMGNKPTYDMVTEKINFLKEKECRSLNAIPVILKDSLPRWKDVVDEYISHGFSVLRFKYVSRFGFASKAWKSMSYEPEEYLEAWKKVINYMIDLNKKGTIITENIASIIILKLLTGLNSNYSEMMTPCGAVIGQLVYNYNGGIYTCDEARTMEEFRIGDVSSSSYEDLLKHETTKTLQSVSNLTSYNCDSGCPWFSFCGICPLEVYTQENGFTTNIPSNYRHKIHEGMFEFIMDKFLHNPEDKAILSKWPYVRPGIVGSSELESENENPFLQRIC